MINPDLIEEPVTCPSFRESVKCESDGDYTIAWGWNESTGQGGDYPYVPPTGWKFDPRYSDERGPIGSHGGCSSCIMTLVHLITTEPTPEPEPEPEPEPKKDIIPILIAIAIIAWMLGIFG